MAIIVEPADVVAEIIRSEVAEPDRKDLGTRQIPTSETFTASASQTTFVLSQFPQCINSVSVDGSDQQKYLDFDIDLRNKKVVLKTALSGGESVVVSYDYGSTWVYPDKPRVDLNKDSYPRISVWTLSEPMTELGMGESNFRSSISLQIEVIAYKDMITEINDDSYEGQQLCDYLARRIVNALKTWRTKYYPALDSFDLVDSFPGKWDEDYGVFKRVMEVRFKGFNVGL